MLTLQRQIEQLRDIGYVVVPDALPQETLAAIHRKYDELMEQRLAEVRHANPNPRHVEVKRILERDSVFESLMDCPATLPIARGVIGADISLASGGEADYRPGRQPAYISWHNDFTWMTDVPYPRQNFWIRCTYFMEDVTADMGPFTLLPGSHKSDGPCPKEYTDAGGQPKEIPGMVRITGTAGTCLLNNSEIWHTNTPNLTDRPRKLIMILYKHSWMRQWEDGYDMTPDFAARQTTPSRKQLCNVGAWHRCNGKWDV